MASSLVAPVAVDYPSSDGKPMAESDAQRNAIVYAVDALQAWFADRDDVFVVIGAADHERLRYKLWEEPKAPDFVLEVASRSTWRKDLGPKRRLYERMGVREYWQYDPTGEYLDERLQG